MLQITDKSDLKTALFIPCFNSDESITRVLDEVLTSEWSWLSGIFIFDNSSTDATVEFIKKWHCDNREALPIRLYLNDQNYSLGGSSILAIQNAIAADMDWLIVFHSD